MEGERRRGRKTGEEDGAGEEDGGGKRRDRRGRDKGREEKRKSINGKHGENKGGKKRRENRGEGKNQKIKDGYEGGKTGGIGKRTERRDWE